MNRALSSDGSARQSYTAMPFYWFTLGAFAVWRITHLFHAEDGPWDVFVRLRQFVGTGVWAKLLDCFYCLSVWIAAPVAVVIGADWKERLLLWPALSAAAILLERLTASRGPHPPAAYFELPEDEYALLRSKQSTNIDSHRVDQ